VKKSLFLILIIGASISIVYGLQFGLGIKHDRYFASAQPSPTISKPTISPIPTPKPNNSPLTIPSPSNSPTQTPTSIDSPAPTPNKSPADISPSGNLPTPNPSISPRLNPKEIARQIVVKIGVPDLIGSGTIISENNGIYTVLTNAHILRGANPPYRVTTPDRAVYPTKVLTNISFKNRDLAILQFKAKPKLYQVAQIGVVKDLKIGDRLYVGGFTKQPPQRDKDDYILQEGAVSIVLKKSIEEGYRLGYTNIIYRGMSGSPVIDSWGRLVGINGLLNDPVWLTRSRFSDGSYPCKTLQLLIDRSSFAIPIDDIIPLIGRSYSLRSSPIATQIPPDNTTEATRRKTLEATANRSLKCQ
jgi:hypothetical protein